MSAGHRVIFEKRRPCRFGCHRDGVTARQAVAITSMAEPVLLREIYEAAGGEDSPMRAEAERRLGMSPPRFPGLRFERVRTPEVAVAVEEVVREALAAAPVIDEERIQAEYLGLRRSWSCRDLWRGSAEEAAQVLRVNLERDTGRPRFARFLVDVPPKDFCVQVSTIFGRPAVFTGYRIWRTDSYLRMCGGSDALL